MHVRVKKTSFIYTSCLLLYVSINALTAVISRDIIFGRQMYSQEHAFYDWEMTRELGISIPSSKVQRWTQVTCQLHLVRDHSNRYNFQGAWRLQSRLFVRIDTFLMENCRVKKHVNSVGYRKLSRHTVNTNSLTMCLYLPESSRKRERKSSELLIKHQ